jgi:ATP-dependent DNA helicase RecQ
MATTKKRRPAQKKQARKKENDILAVAWENFGFESLRSGQEDAIRALLDGNDSLVVQPTGSGKSAIYQITALMLNGATLVISPLTCMFHEHALIQLPAAEDHLDV